MNFWGNLELNVDGINVFDIVVYAPPPSLPGRRLSEHRFHLEMSPLTLVCFVDHEGVFNLHR